MSKVAASGRRHLEVFDEQMGALVAQARREGHTVPCRPGCDACCYDIATVAHTELAAIVERLRGFDRATLTTIRHGVLEWLSRMGLAGIDPSDPLPDLRAYHRAHAACPLLDRERHECRVYDVRPFACRGHFVIDVDPAVCANRAAEPEVQVLNVDRALLVMAKALARELPKSMRILMGMLPALLAEAWPLVDEPERSIDEWVLMLDEVS